MAPLAVSNGSTLRGEAGAHMDISIEAAAARDPLAQADVRMEAVAGRELRVATWRLDEDSAHPPLVFLNGIGANIEAIGPLAHALPERALIALDMPGTGGSPDPVMPYTLATMSCALAALLKRLEVGPVDLAGLSWGGALAQQFALQHPRSVRRLILAASSAGAVSVPGDLRAARALTDALTGGRRAAMNEVFAALYGPVGEAGARAAAHRHVGQLTAPSARGFWYQAMALMGWTSLPALPFLRAPTLVLAGERDAIVPPANAAILHGAIPHSRLRTIAGGGHLFLFSHPDASVAAIRDFLDTPQDRLCWAA